MVRKNAHTIFSVLDPIIYQSVADRIELLRYPRLVVKFYMRLIEIQQVIEVTAVGPGGDNAPVPAGEAETLANSLIITIRLAQAIISQLPDPSLDERVPGIALEHINAALESAKRTFPPPRSPST
jgi:hypothetical protein